MTLTTHAVVGAAAASLFPQMPLAAFAAGFASHFIIDAIPHWDEGGALLRSQTLDPHDPLNTDMRLGRDFVHDVGVVAADALLGLAASLLIFSVWLFHVPLFIILIGVVAGILPDPLQFLYFKTRWRLMTPLQNFHIHLQTELASPLFLGIEVALIAAIVCILKFVYPL